jgi:hypothetical protein
MVNGMDTSLPFFDVDWMRSEKMRDSEMGVESIKRRD